MRSRKITALSINTLGILKSNSKIKKTFLVVALNSSCSNKAFFFLDGYLEECVFGVFGYLWGDCDTHSWDGSATLQIVSAPRPHVQGVGLD